MSIRPLTIAACAALALGGCSDGSSSRHDTAPPEPVPATTPQDTGPPAAPDAAPAPATSSDPGEEPRPARVARRADDGPPLAGMLLARSVGKIGVPVEMRYQVSGAVVKDQPATVQLAVSPRVTGTNLRVEFPETAGVTVDGGWAPVWAEKASNSDVFRSSVQVTPTASDGGEFRAIVSMDLDGGRYFSVFSIPVGTRPGASKK